MSRLLCDGVFLLLLTVVVDRTSGAYPYTPRPNIVFILADDLGTNDLSITDPRIYTPNIQALYDQSLKLENYYVQATCTPSRAAFMTGYYPFHLGLQRGVFRPDDPRYLPLNVPTLPELLQQKGYQTAGIGKWHLGFCRDEVVPTNRGFHTFYGHYLGSSDYLTHIRSYLGTPGHDFRENTVDSIADDGQYATNLFTDRTVDIIRQHNGTVPLFVYLAHLAPHSPIKALGRYMDMNRDNFTDATDKYRLKKAAMITAMDEGVGEVVQALKDKDMWDNTILIFSSDNGGAVEYGGSNYPYRGAKGNLYEGGTRSVGFIHARSIGEGTFDGLFHITDWLPTLLTAADECNCAERYTGTNISGDHLPLDGIDHWLAFNRHRTNTDPIRTEIVYNINEKIGAAAYRTKRYKLIVGNQGKYDGWFNHYLHLSNQTMIGPLSTAEKPPGFPDLSKHAYQLFNLILDPYEQNDISQENPDAVDLLYSKLRRHRSTMVPAFNPDPRVEESSPDNYKVDHDGWEVSTWSPGWCDDVDFRV